MYAMLMLSRFHAIVEMLKPERPDSTVSLKGLDYVDVPALNKRDYRISFFSYKECQYNAKVLPNPNTFCTNSTKYLGIPKSKFYCP